MRYNRDRVQRRLLVVAAPSLAPYEIRSSRLVGSSSNLTSEHSIQTGYDQADPSLLHLIRRNQRTVNLRTVREAGTFYAAIGAAEVFVAANRETLFGGGSSNSNT
jgi:hypothetical protein